MYGTTRVPDPAYLKPLTFGYQYYTHTFMALTSLPTEIQEYIAGHCDAGSVFRLIATCRQLQEACKPSTVWRSIIARHWHTTQRGGTEGCGTLALSALVQHCDEDIQRYRRYAIAVCRASNVENNSVTDMKLTNFSAQVDEHLSYMPHLRIFDCKMISPWHVIGRRRDIMSYRSLTLM